MFSNASQNLYQENTTAAFAAELAQAIDLVPSDACEVGFCEMSYLAYREGPILVPGDTKDVVYYEMASQQYVCNNWSEIQNVNLSIDTQHIFNTIYFLHVEKQTVKYIRLEMLKMNVSRVGFEFSTTPSKNDLHFIRVSAQ